MDSESLFRPLEELDDHESSVALASLAAASATFGQFQDHPESHYYRAEGLSARETWQRVTEEVARVTAILAHKAVELEMLEPSNVEAVHRAIFEPVFGARTLRMRKYEEGVVYGIVCGTREIPEHKRQLGISGRSLPSAIRRHVGDLNAAFARRDELVARRKSRQLLEATIPAATFYSRLLADHPFEDGNGRTAFPLLSFALIRLGAVSVAVPETTEFHWCLGCGMKRSGRSFDPMAEYLADQIRKSAP